MLPKQRTTRPTVKSTANLELGIHTLLQITGPASAYEARASHLQSNHGGLKSENAQKSLQIWTVDKYVKPIVEL